MKIREGGIIMTKNIQNVLNVAVLLILVNYAPLAQSATEIDWNKLVNAVIICESGGDPNAVNKKSGAIGLMQIRYCVLKEWNEEQQRQSQVTVTQLGEKAIYYDIPNKKYNTLDLFNDEKNMEISIWYLHKINDHYLKDISGIPSGNVIYVALPNRPLEDQINCVQDNETWKFKTKVEYKISLILCAWNWGIGNLKKANYDINKSPKETKQFIKKVLVLYNK